MLWNNITMHFSKRKIINVDSTPVCALFYLQNQFQRKNGALLLQNLLKRLMVEKQNRNQLLNVFKMSSALKLLSLMHISML